MSEDSNSTDIDLQPEHSNSKLIYEYTESYLKYFDKGLDSVKQKATTLLGFSPIVLKFAAELPSSDSWLTITKVGTCILIVINITICIIILNPSKAGDVIEPSELIEDWFYKEVDLIRLFISRQWIKACEQLDEEYDRKAKLLIYCYSCIGIASILFALNVIFSTICIGN